MFWHGRCCFGERSKFNFPCLCKFTPFILIFITHGQSILTNNLYPIVAVSEYMIHRHQFKVFFFKSEKYLLGTIVSKYCCMWCLKIYILLRDAYPHCFWFYLCHYVTNESVRNELMETRCTYLLQAMERKLDQAETFYTQIFFVVPRSSFIVPLFNILKQSTNYLSNIAFTRSNSCYSNETFCSALDGIVNLWQIQARGYIYILSLPIYLFSIFFLHEISVNDIVV